MSARLLDGSGLAKEREGALAERVARLRARGIIPRLVVLLSEEGAYFRAKKRSGERVGIEVEPVRFPPPDRMKGTIERLVADPAVSGIMVEAPLPSGIDPSEIRGSIPAAKDVDCFGREGLGLLLAGGPVFPPATPAAVLALLDGYGIDLVGRDVVVVGRSLVVGRPLALLLLDRDATVTVCHSHTRELPSQTRRADIVCVAAGKPGLLTGEMVKPGAIVVDIGTNPTASGLVGDVDFESVEDVAGWISPVPGGVGPLTTTILLEHVVEAAERGGG